MVHYAGYAPRFHPSDFETRTRDGVGADWPISYGDLQAALRARRARAAGRRPGLAVGRPAPLPARAAPDLAARPSAPGRARARHGIEMRVGPVGDRQRHLRQPAALHLPRLLPAGLQGQRQGSARWSRTCPTRSRTASRSAPTPWSPRVEIDDATGAATGVTLRPRTGSERFQRAAAVAVAGYSIETPRLLLQLDQPRAIPHGLGNNDDQVGRYVMVQGAPQVAGAVPRDAAACTRRRRRRSPPSSSTRPTQRARVRARLLDPDRRRRCRSAGPSTCSPTATGAARCASTCATTTTGRCSARSASCCRSPTTASRSPTSPTSTGMPVARFDYTPVRQRPRQHRLRASRRSTTIWDAAGAQDMLTIDRYAHLVGGCRMGTAPGRQRRRRRPPGLGRAEPVRRRRQRDADPGRAPTRR